MLLGHTAANCKVWMSAFWCQGVNLWGRRVNVTCQSGLQVAGHCWKFAVSRLEEKVFYWWEILQSILIKPTYSLCNQQIDESEKMVLVILFMSLPCVLNAHWSRPLICRSPPNRLSSFFVCLKGPACRDLGFSKSQLPRRKVSQSYRHYANQQRRIIKYNQNKICCAISNHKVYSDHCCCPRRTLQQRSIYEVKETTLKAEDYGSRQIMIRFKELRQCM